MESTASERRSVQRVPFDVHVHVRGLAGREVVLMSHDWSEHGVFLRTHEPFALRTPVQMYVVTTHPPIKVELSGVVARVIKSSDRDVHLPAGMVVTFRRLPPELRDFLRRSTGDKAALPVAAPVELTVLPSITLVGGAPEWRAAALQSLGTAGYDVNEAEDVAGFVALLDKGAAPDAVVLFDESGESLAGLVKHFSTANAPQVAIEVGVAPHDIEQALGFALVVLPPSTAPEHLPEIAKLFLPEKVRLIEVEPIDAEETPSTPEPVAQAPLGERVFPSA